MTINKNTWNTYYSEQVVVNFEMNDYAFDFSQVRLGANGWKKRIVRITDDETETNKSRPWYVDNHEGIGAFEMAKTFQRGA